MTGTIAGYQIIQNRNMVLPKWGVATILVRSRTKKLRGIVRRTPQLYYVHDPKFIIDEKRHIIIGHPVMLEALRKEVERERVG